MEGPIVTTIPVELLLMILQCIRFKDRMYTLFHAVPMVCRQWRSLVPKVVSDRKEVMQALEMHCDLGNMELVQWLCDAFGIDRTKDDVIYPWYYPYSLSDEYKKGPSCIGDYWWFRGDWRSLKFGSRDAKKDNYLLVTSCCGGHFDIARYLHERFVYDKGDLFGVKMYIFREVCKKGYLEIAKWIHATFGVMYCFDYLCVYTNV